MTENTRELELRLADAAELLATLPTDENDEAIGIDPALHSALGHALSGSSGCIEPDEWQDRREDALEARREELGLDA